jgi:hypothetical protein
LQVRHSRNSSPFMEKRSAGTIAAIWPYPEPNVSTLQLSTFLFQQYF